MLGEERIKVVGLAAGIRSCIFSTHQVHFRRTREGRRSAFRRGDDRGKGRESGPVSRSLDTSSMEFRSDAFFCCDDDCVSVCFVGD